MSITTSTGTVVEQRPGTLPGYDGEPEEVHEAWLSNPDYSDRKIGYFYGGMLVPNPSPVMDFGMYPETLRAIADLIEQEADQ